jgi:mevalonate kinase
MDTGPAPIEAHASACGKAIIVGEHAVVYGTHAVALPLKQMRLQLTLTPLPRHDKQQIQLTMAGHEASPRVNSVLSDAMELLGSAPFSLSAKSHNALPIGAGLGSSATLCVATLRALTSSLGYELPPDQLAAYANELEKRFHGTPSGLDAAVVAYEACILFAKNKPILPISLKLPAGHKSWEFLLIDSCVRASTMAMIRQAEPYFKGRSGERHLQSFDDLSWLVYGALQQGDVTTVGAAMNECGHLLRAASVVPDSLEEMIELCRKIGLPGVKTTGAGGGGMILGLLDPEKADAQQEAVKAAFPQHSVFRVAIES